MPDFEIIIFLYFFQSQKTFFFLETSMKSYKQNIYRKLGGNFGKKENNKLNQFSAVFCRNSHESWSLTV